MYSLPSASQIRGPSPLAATMGSPPTPRKARTGEFTPPGKSSRARAINSADRTLAAVASDRHLLDGKLAGHATLLVSTSWKDDTNHRRLKVVIIYNFFHRYLDNCAWRQRLIDLRYAINVVGLPWQPRLRRTALRICPIHESQRRAARPRLVFPGSDRALKLGQSLQPLPLHRFVHILRVLRRPCSFLRRGREPAPALELHLLEELEQLLELFIGLTREADDARSADRDIGDRITEFLHAFANRALSFRAAHARQYQIGAVL